MVGEAVAFGLRRVGHEIIVSDPAKGHYGDILSTEMIFICVPTPGLPDGACDTSIVEHVVRVMRDVEGYSGLLVIKSTVTPGTTDRLYRLLATPLAFCPEFLRERARFSDFCDNHEVCIAGVYHAAHADMIREAHGSLPKHFIEMTPIEAELTKYFVNCFNAYRVNFANAFYEVCRAVGAHYETVMRAAVKRAGVPSDYLVANEQTRAFGGSCLPKDTAALASFVASLDLKTELFRHIVAENDRVMLSA
jgi:UDPglucose 6-dehydrogenase